MATVLDLEFKFPDANDAKAAFDTVRDFAEKAIDSVSNMTKSITTSDETWKKATSTVSDFSKQFNQWMNQTDRMIRQTEIYKSTMHGVESVLSSVDQFTGNLTLSWTNKLRIAIFLTKIMWKYRAVLIPIAKLIIAVTQSTTAFYEAVRNDPMGAFNKGIEKSKKLLDDAKKKMVEFWEYLKKLFSTGLERFKKFWDGVGGKDQKITLKQTYIDTLNSVKQTNTMINQTNTTIGEYNEVTGEAALQTRTWGDALLDISGSALKGLVTVLYDVGKAIVTTFAEVGLDALKLFTTALGDLGTAMADFAVSTYRTNRDLSRGAALLVDTFGGELHEMRAQLRSVAIETSTSLESVTGHMKTMGLAMRGLGRDSKESTQFLTKMIQATRSYGSYGAELNGILQQLTRAQINNKISLQLLTTLAQGSPLLFKKMADAFALAGYELEAWNKYNGVTLDSMKAWVEEGVDAQAVLYNFTQRVSESREITKTFTETTKTWGDQWESIKLAVGGFIHEFIRLPIISKWMFKLKLVIKGVTWLLTEGLSTVASFFIKLTEALKTINDFFDNIAYNIKKFIKDTIGMSRVVEDYLIDPILGFLGFFPKKVNEARGELDRLHTDQAKGARQQVKINKAILQSQKLATEALEQYAKTGKLVDEQKYLFHQREVNQLKAIANQRFRDHQQTMRNHEEMGRYMEGSNQKEIDMEKSKQHELKNTIGLRESLLESLREAGVAEQELDLKKTEYEKLDKERSGNALDRLEDKRKALLENIRVEAEGDQQADVFANKDDIRTTYKITNAKKLSLSRREGNAIVLKSETELSDAYRTVARVQSRLKDTTTRLSKQYGKLGEATKEAATETKKVAKSAIDAGNVFTWLWGLYKSGAKANELYAASGSKIVTINKAIDKTNKEQKQGIQELEHATKKLTAVKAQHGITVAAVTNAVNANTDAVRENNAAKREGKKDVHNMHLRTNKTIEILRTATGVTLYYGHISVRAYRDTAYEIARAKERLMEKVRALADSGVAVDEYGRKIGKTTKRVNALNKVQEDLKGSLDSSTSSFIRQTDAVEDATDSFADYNKVVSGASGTVDDFSSSLSKSSSAVTKSAKTTSALADAEAKMADAVARHDPKAMYEAQVAISHARQQLNKVTNDGVDIQNKSNEMLSRTIELNEKAASSYKKIGDSAKESAKKVTTWIDPKTGIAWKELPKIKEKKPKEEREPQTWRQYTGAGEPPEGFGLLGNLIGSGQMLGKMARSPIQQLFDSITEGVQEGLSVEEAREKFSRRGVSVGEEGVATIHTGITGQDAWMKTTWEEFARKALEEMDADKLNEMLAETLHVASGIRPPSTADFIGLGGDESVLAKGLSDILDRVLFVKGDEAGLKTLMEEVRADQKITPEEITLVKQAVGETITENLLSDEIRREPVLEKIIPYLQQAINIQGGILDHEANVVLGVDELQRKIDYNHRLTFGTGKVVTRDEAIDLINQGTSVGQYIASLMEQRETEREAASGGGVGGVSEQSLNEEQSRRISLLENELNLRDNFARSIARQVTPIGSIPMLSGAGYSTPTTPAVDTAPKAPPPPPVVEQTPPEQPPIEVTVVIDPSQIVREGLESTDTDTDNAIQRAVNRPAPKPRGEPNFGGGVTSTPYGGNDPFIYTATNP